MITNSQDFIFHTDLTPLSVPFRTVISITGSSSLLNNEHKTIASPWIDTVNGKLALQADISVGGYVYPDWAQEVQYLPAPTYGCYANIRTEMNSLNQVRVVLEEYNYTGANQTFTPKTFSIQFNMYHII